MSTPGENRREAEKYWQARSSLLYYQVVRNLVAVIGTEARSILDVGSAGCPYLDWHPHIPERVSLDKWYPYSSPGVTGIKADFLAWEPDRRFDIVTCLQVIEHIPRPDIFARKLMAVGRVVIVSVPYMWNAGAASSHVNDPVDEEKMRLWFGRKPNFQYICQELVVNSRRLIQVYEEDGVRWKDLNQRARRRKNRPANIPADLAAG